MFTTESLKYDTLEEMVKTALQVGAKDTSMLDVFSNLDQVIEIRSRRKSTRGPYFLQTYNLGSLNAIHICIGNNFYD